VIGHPIFHADQQQTDKQEESLSALALLFFAAFVLQREVFKHFDEDSRPREDKIIHNKVAKAAKTNHCRSLIETVLSSWPLRLCVRFSLSLVAVTPLCDLLRLFLFPPHLGVRS
jgi:hypothetical protein